MLWWLKTMAVLGGPVVVMGNLAYMIAGMMVVVVVGAVLAWEVPP